MSNGDDVLDNWEEIDEEGLSSSAQNLKNSSASPCEEITKDCYHDTGLATSSVETVSCATTTFSSNITQMKLLQRSNPQTSTTSSSMSQPLIKSPLDDMSATFQPVMMVLHKPQDEYQSANYTGPIANQTVKILRRPSQSTENRNNCVRPKQPIKTLQQREQEYAEARLRILGSAKNPEDDEQRSSTVDPTSVITSVTDSTSSSTSALTLTAAAMSNNSMSNMLATATKINSPKIQVNANQYNNHFNQQQQQQQQKYLQNYQQQQQQSYFYTKQQQPQTPAYNNNRTYNVNPLLTLGPMGAIGQPAQYHITTLSSPQQTQQQHLKFQQYHQKSPQQQHKPQQPQQQQQQTWSPVVGGSVSSSSLRQQQQSNDTILRLPHGPDGTTGFQMHR